MATSRNRNPSPSQARQRKLFQALGYVTGFQGYLTCLVETVKSAEFGTRVDATHLIADVTRLRTSLYEVQDSIRVSMKEGAKSE